MPNNDLPRTVDEQPISAPASAAPQGTTAPDEEVSAEATTGLDLRGYELSERLGGGGMGDVYRAGDPALGRDLAVKVMKADLQGYAAAEQRFLREARVTGSLQHPGIVPIYNLGRLSDGRLHYTMRLVRGRTFADILKEEAGQPERLPALLAIFEKICQAVAYAHSKRVLHRDLKPANIMVGRFGEVQVMDWGLAKLLTPGERGCVSALNEEDEGGTRIPTESGETPQEITRLGREMGTPGYMPPEQALGEWDTVDERADVFALGAILCQILTGRPPYSGGEALQKAKRGDLTEALARLENCGADEALLGLCRECLAPAREGRPRDAEQVAKRIAAYQIEVQERLRRAEMERAKVLVEAREERKRRRWIQAAVLLLVAGVVISTCLTVWAIKAQQTARHNEKQATGERDQKEQALQLAEDRLGLYENATATLVSVFQDLDPSAEQKGGPSLREQLSHRLEKAAAQLEEMVKRDALTAARLRAALGRSLIALGQYRQAIELLQEALPVLETQLGLAHDHTLNAVRNLESAYFFSGQRDRGVRLWEQTRAKVEAELGSGHTITQGVLRELAMAYKSIGHAEKGVPLLKQVWQTRQSQQGADELDTLATLSELIGVCLAARHRAELPALLEQMEIGLRQRLEKERANPGPDFVRALRQLDNLALICQFAGRLDKAVPLLEWAREEWADHSGPDHPDTLAIMHALAGANHAAGELDKAISLYEQTLEKRRIKLAPDHPKTLTTLRNLAESYREKGKLDREEVLYREWLQLLLKKGGPEEASLHSVLALLGANLLAQKKFTEAEPVLSECLTRRAKKLPGQWLTFNTQSLLGEALLGQKKYAEAEPLLVQGYDGMKQRQGKIPLAYRQLRLTEALERLARLYEATDQKDKAADWRKKLDEVKAAHKKSKP